MCASKLLQQATGFSGPSPGTALDLQNSHSYLPIVIHVCTILPYLHTTHIMIYLILFLYWFYINSLFKTRAAIACNKIMDRMC